MFRIFLLGTEYSCWVLLILVCSKLVLFLLEGHADENVIKVFAQDGIH